MHKSNSLHCSLPRSTIHDKECLWERLRNSNVRDIEIRLTSSQHLDLIFEVADSFIEWLILDRFVLAFLEENYAFWLLDMTWECCLMIAQRPSFVSRPEGIEHNRSPYHCTSPPKKNLACSHQQCKSSVCACIFQFTGSWPSLLLMLPALNLPPTTTSQDGRFSWEERDLMA